MSENIRKVNIGYLCSHGHYCLTADPEERGQCGSKDIGAVYVELDLDAGEHWCERALEEAQESLAQKIEAWRNCECDAS